MKKSIQKNFCTETETCNADLCTTSGMMELYYVVQNLLNVIFCWTYVEN